MERKLTAAEERFLKILKRELFFTKIEIRTKVSMEELSRERSDITLFFGNDYSLIRDIDIDFVLYRNGKVIAGIEIVDEADELNLNKGQELLIDTVFMRLGYELFRVTDPEKLNEAARIIRKKITEKK